MTRTATSGNCCCFWKESKQNFFLRILVVSCLLQKYRYTISSILLLPTHFSYQILCRQKDIRWEAQNEVWHTKFTVSLSQLLLLLKALTLLLLYPYLLWILLLARAAPSHELSHMKRQTAATALFTMFSMQRTAAFTVRQFGRVQARAISGTSFLSAEKGQAEVILVGCGAPNRGAFLASLYSMP
jgi:hypothetical protein